MGRSSEPIPLVIDGACGRKIDACTDSLLMVTYDLENTFG